MKKDTKVVALLEGSDSTRAGQLDLQAEWIKETQNPYRDISYGLTKAQTDAKLIHHYSLNLQINQSNKGDSKKKSGGRGDSKLKNSKMQGEPESESGSFGDIHLNKLYTSEFGTKDFHADESVSSSSDDSDNTSSDDSDSDDSTGSSDMADVYAKARRPS